MSTLALTLFLALSGATQVEQAQLPRSQSLTLQGWVVDAGGAPAAGALVTSNAGGRALAGADGAFQLELPLPTTPELHITAVRTRASETQIASLRTSAPTSARRLVVGTLALGTGPCEPSWLPTFGEHHDLPHGADALLVHDDGHGPRLFAGGERFVARLDGARWTLLGSFNGQVRCLALLDEGSGPRLFAGGGFFQVDGTYALGVARWDGASWSTVGSLVAGTLPDVYALEAHDDGSGPALYAGGKFTVPLSGASVRNFARWDGTRWAGIGNPPGSFDLQSVLLDLASFDDGRGGGPQLYAIEKYFPGGFSDKHRLLRWNGTNWSVTTEAFWGYVIGSPGTVEDLAVFDDGGGPALYVSGAFRKVATATAYGIARWDGLGWRGLGTPSGTRVQKLGVADDGSGTALFAARGEGHVERWDGLAWTRLPDMLTEAEALSFAGFDDGSGARVFVGSQGLVHASYWNGTTWSAIGGGLSGPVTALAVFDDGLGGGPALYVGGELVVVDHVPVHTVARWDGASWSAVGGELSTVAVLHVHDDGTGTALYAAGQQENGLAHVMKWNGTSWTTLGPGFDRRVRALTSFDDGLGSGPQLIAAGDFSRLAFSGPQRLRVARWDGASWAALGSGLNSTVTTLIVHDDGLGGGPALYAGGIFTSAGAVPALRVARWDGTSWTALGGGLAQEVRSLATFDDGTGAGQRLYAGGDFAGGVARWDGIAWSTLGSAATVGVLAVHDDGRGPALYAAGTFLGAGGVAPRGIARWDGARWSALGSGVDNGLGRVQALLSTPAVLGAPSLFVGGAFPDIGGTGDSFLGLWQGCAPPVLACPSEIVQGTADASGAVVSFTVTATGSGSPPPTVTCVPPSGSTFPIGTTLVTCTAIDAGGLQATCGFSVHVFRKTQAR
jgi:HYR domain-containing protein